MSNTIPDHQSKMTLEVDMLLFGEREMCQLEVTAKLNEEFINSTAIWLQSSIHNPVLSW